MNNTEESLDAFRTAAVAAGFRTIAAKFSGSGDEGQVHVIGLPVGTGINHTTPLDPVSWANVPVTVEGFSETYSGTHSLLALAKDNDVDLYLEFNDVLDHFPGDWCNDEGGYGNVYLDLVTGVYWIDGHENVTTTSPAKNDGVYLEPWPEPTLDVVAQLRALLQP